MNEKLIYGIQQIGIGVENADVAFKWYATILGADALIFDDYNEATYMAKYMGGKSRKKRALLAMNLQGGAGYEIWQYADRKPSKPTHEFKIGDLGINFPCLKTRNIEKTYDRLQNLQQNIISKIVVEPDLSKCFYIKDPFNNILKIKEFSSFYTNNKGELGGVFSAVLGVSNIENSLKLYADILGYDNVIYDKTACFDDLSALNNGDKKFRRILLSHSKERVGGFSKLLGNSQIELIQAIENTPNKIFENRFWGDLGYIHLCFDISNMKILVEECKEKKLPFQVLSAPSFDMGDANGHWGYIEDADGTLIEFIETHKVPLIKKLGIYINLKNRNPKKSLPNWMLKGMSLKRVKKFKI
ncbi:VOC family protein [Polaribacter glomeratus]|uniref:Glyoxalase n=1 Tax=Polaribacter glomeratus TaxID=102 RepID=A0A2S7WIT9_9FLAO|nr:VOC family protein [Polaribacter glomeratus]PQJ77529.1 glyoxalase [Polaribacter glomeratus]TXD66121.1 VOC family protein [Polaribacter glomeratus]